MGLFFTTFYTYAQNILPWYLVGTLVAGLLGQSFFKKTIQIFLGRVSLVNIMASQILGMISPLSVMSALPVVGELIHLGAKPVMLISFLVAERAYDLQTFFIITDLFSLRFAVINATIIFISLFFTFWLLKNEKFKFSSGQHKSIEKFWPRQFKTLMIITIGLVIASLLRVIIPQTGWTNFMGAPIGSIITSLVLGFTLYFGTILGNYPVARAFSDLGMASVGTMVFLTVSPILNFVVMLLFSSIVSPKIVIKSFLIYSIISLTLSIAYYSIAY